MLSSPVLFTDMSVSPVQNVLVNVFPLLQVSHIYMGHGLPGSHGSSNHTHNFDLSSEQNQRRFSTLCLEYIHTTLFSLNHHLGGYLILLQVCSFLVLHF